jgi:hypothetical protein
MDFPKNSGKVCGKNFRKICLFLGFFPWEAKILNKKFAVKLAFFLGWEAKIL